MLWIIVIVVIAFMLYVVYSLSTIKDQIKLISTHLHVKESETKIPEVSNEEIEKELEDELMK